MKLYIIRNKENKYYRSKGYGGYGDSWVDDIQKCRMYTKVGSAKRQITYWAKNYPEYGTPDILELDAKITQVINQEDRVSDIIKEQNRRKNIARVNELSRKFRDAKKRYDEAVEELDNYHNEVDDIES